MGPYEQAMEENEHTKKANTLNVRVPSGTLARLRKRMRVMVHKGAFDDLG